MKGNFQNVLKMKFPNVNAVVTWRTVLRRLPIDACDGSRGWTAVTEQGDTSGRGCHRYARSTSPTHRALCAMRCAGTKRSLCRRGQCGHQRVHPAGALAARRGFEAQIKLLVIRVLQHSHLEHLLHIFRASRFCILFRGAARTAPTQPTFSDTPGTS